MKAESTKYRLEDVIKALKLSAGKVYIAAEKLGSSPQTIYNYAKRFSEVKQVIRQQRGLRLDRAEDALEKAVEAGEGWAVCFTLKTLGKKRGYVEKQQIESDVRIDPAIHQDVRLLRDELQKDPTYVDYLRDRAGNGDGHAGSLGR